MKLFLACLLLVCVFGLISSERRDGEPSGNRRKSTRLNRYGDKLSYNRRTGQVNFPEELEFDFFIRGERTVRARSRKVSKARPIPTFDGEGREHRRNRQNQQFYVDDKGSYQVSATARADGTLDTDVKALYRNGKGQKCFFARGESSCWRIDGKGKYAKASWKGDTIEIPKRNESKIRSKRQQLVYTDFVPSRVFKVVYVVDRAFMEWFRDLNPGDDATAITDAEDYIYMLNNEVNYMYRGIKEVSESSATIPDMDITVHAKGFYYPNIGTEWTWLRQYISSGTINIDSGGNRGGALPTFGQWVNSGSVSSTGPFDTATFLTPRDITNEGSSVLGTAYLRTVCNPIADGFRVSINRDGYYDVATTLTHELGHSIGAEHDDALGCAISTYLMSPTTFRITPRTQDTWNRWSTCSTTEIVAHVSKYAGCLLDEVVSEDDFYDNLCLGNRGGNQFDINFQCKTAYKDENSVVCEPTETVSTGKVPAVACWDDRKVRCTNRLNVCSFRIFTVFDGTPCIGTDSSKDYVCYRGDCLEKVDVCAGRPTTCTCGALWGQARTSCCRSLRNPDNSCCYGCTLNNAGSACRSDWTVTN